MARITSTTPDFPMPRTCPFDPPKAYGDLRRDSPISRVNLPTGRTAWVVASGAHVRTLLADPRLSIRRDNPGFPALAEFDQNQIKQFTNSLMGEDPPEHTELRRMVMAEFTLKRIQTMRSDVQRLVDTHIDAILAGDSPVDLVEALAMPIPSLVICELLGVPYDDHEFFQDRTRTYLGLSSPEQRFTARLDLANYMDDLVKRAEIEPGDDLIGRLIIKTRAEGIYEHGKIADLARLLLLAGHETTASMITMGTVALWHHPSQLDKLIASPSLWPQAVEELLRYFSVADFVPGRTALADIDIGGVTIAEGDGVLLLTASANRDGEMFDNPDTLDVQRNSRQHVAFGYGVHQCLGQNLARLQLEIVYRTLFERIPTLKVAMPIDELPYRSETFVHGLSSLPVTW